jgi:hypothetical protein
MPKGICKLCLKDRNLQEGHLIGRAIYRQFRQDEGKDPIVMTPEVVLHTSRQVKDYLCCRECEDRFNKGGEKYVAGLVWRPTGFPLLDRLKLALPIERGRSFQVFSGTQTGIDTEKLAYYALSVVWRAAAHVWQTIGKQTTTVVMQDAERENIRSFLAGEGVFPSRTGVVVTACTDLGSQTHVLYPTALAHPLYQEYIFLVKGIRLSALLARAPQTEFSQVCCVTSPLKRIFVSDGSQFTIEAVRPFHEKARVARNVRS